MKTQAAMTGDLRRVTAMIESPVTTYLVLGFLVWAESLSPVLEAVALKRAQGEP